ncbi:hypothetical protein HOP50_04g31060 [Chloropicon primus]|uniref:IPT/TIG domain-containing protein n=1 Tax=Chloropicon primus TaxID=1764295 RepID=A0A5B8MJC4_9CHLO|nr:hypothetical protein A3770_04p31040 [Chloropicon primus]UPQ99797.1 hypothetical protein HOP50_04g31060 [Chloropicon primus]|eukprot:QDZ20586.1 hypothetical protein A3770_04p31040 [Chloropicon primus]
MVGKGAKIVIGLTLCVLLTARTASGQTIDWCADAASEGSVYEAYYGQETCIPLCVKKSGNLSYDGNLGIEKVTLESPGVYPTGAVFQYPYDEINFPASGVLKTVAGHADTDPFKRNFCFTPQHGEECVYTACFKGKDNDSSSSATSVRCYKIEVYNQALEFTGAEEASSADLSKEVGPKNGFSMGAWVYPTCSSAGNQTVMYFGSTRDFATSLGTDTGLQVRNAIKYNTDSSGESTFFYYDDYIGTVFAENKYCCGKWHYVGVSVGSDNKAFLFVDGGMAKSQVTGSRNTIKFDVKSFETASRPDNNLDGDGQGTFKVGHYTGEGFKGIIDEVSVFDKALTSAEMHSNMEKRDLSGSENLKGYFTMTGSGFPLANSAGTATLTNSVGTPALVPKAIPTMIPCVLGLQHSVGPSDGSCPTEVYGWSMSDGLATACSFGGRVIGGTYVDDKTIKCETPGHVSPRYVNVLASNDAGTQFTTSLVGKEVKHLYMESSLYVDGNGGGAEADSVCKDLPTRAVTFGGWFCPKCGPPSS